MALREGPVPLPKCIAHRDDVLALLFGPLGASIGVVVGGLASIVGMLGLMLSGSPHKSLFGDAVKPGGVERDAAMKGALGTGASTKVSGPSPRSAC